MGISDVETKIDHVLTSSTSNASWSNEAFSAALSVTIDDARSLDAQYRTTSCIF
jgi:hypothetical protein